VCDPDLVEVLGLGDVASSGRVRDRISRDPLDVDVASLRIDLDVTRDGVAEGLDLGERVVREDIRL
jgi:hypothetical protein